MKKTLYIIFLIPLTLATLVTGILATYGVFFYFSYGGPCGHVMSQEFLEQRLELSSCTEEEKEANPNDCAGIEQTAAACGGLGVLLMLGFFASCIFIPFFWFYVFKVRKRVFK